MAGIPPVDEKEGKVGERRGLEEYFGQRVRQVAGRDAGRHGG